jgi:peptide/nickel transport system substrate-binding protein
MKSLLTRISLPLVLSLLVAMLANLALAQMYQESPLLAERVAAGELPPIDERLPVNPKVAAMESIGKYGGIIRISNTADNMSWMYRKPEQLDYEAGFGGPIGSGLYHSWEWNDDGTAVTFHIREGLRWSDGELFNADDVLWWWNYYQVYTPDPETQPLGLGTRQRLYSYNLQAPTLEKIDDITIRWTFPGPNPAFMHNITYGTNGPEFFPPQWVEPAHPEFQGFADDDVESRIAQWAESVCGSCFGPTAQYQIDGYPTMSPFVVEHREEGIRTTYVRNPFYWQVDAEGNQLPYLDGIEVSLVSEMDLRLARLVTGEIDVANAPFWNSWRLLDLPFILENQERGGYRTYLQPSARAWAPQLYFNQTGPVRNRLYLQNRDFRIALSIAIDRDEINELLYQGLGEIWNIASREGSVGYIDEEGFGLLHTQYDPDAANAVLDGLGLTERNADGIRLGPDGNPISLVFAIADPAEPFETVELIADYWRALGLEILIRGPMVWPEPRTDRASWDVFAHYTEAGGFYLTRLDKWHPYELFSTWDWGNWWRSDGREGIEPPPTAQEWQRYYFEEVLTAPNEEVMDERMQNLMRLSVENMWTNMTLYLPNVQSVNVDLRNVREDFSLEASNLWARPEIWWFDR